MELNKYGFIAYPTGVRIPSNSVPAGTTVTVEGEPIFGAILQMVVRNNRNLLTAGLKLKAAEEAVSVLKGHCTVREFFEYNILHNPDLTPVIKKFLTETLGYLDGEERRVSPRMAHELIRMPYSESQHHVPVKASKHQSKFPTFSNERMVEYWFTRNDGYLDILWTFDALFGG